MNNKKILVTGGAGYIGSHMVLALKEAGYVPFILDNLSRSNTKSIGCTPFVKIDLRSKEELSQFFSKNKFDAVLHFAAFAYVNESVKNPISYYDNNLLGAINLLNVMHDNGSPPLVFSSTCATYGEPKFLPVSELHPQSPINPYGVGKLFIETILKDYNVAYSQKSISLRYFNAAGCDLLGRTGECHDPETHIIPLILKEALRTKRGGNPLDTNLEIFGNNFQTPDGSCVRDFIHVSDLCDAHILALNRLINKKTVCPEFYNLANGKGYSIFEIIEKSRQVTGQDILFTLKKRRRGDPAILVGDSTLAEKELNWKPRNKNLKDIIDSAWKWMLKEEKILKS